MAGQSKYIKDIKQPVSPNRLANNFKNTPGAKDIKVDKVREDSKELDETVRDLSKFYGGKRRSSKKTRKSSKKTRKSSKKTRKSSNIKKRDVPNVVKEGVLSKYHFYNNMKDQVLFDVKKPSDIRKWNSKEERLNHYKKIKQSIIYMQKGWFGTNKCANKGDMYVEYPYFDMRTCAEIKPGIPIDIPDRKFLIKLRSLIGGPLEVMYQMGPYVKYDGK